MCFVTCSNIFAVVTRVVEPKAYQTFLKVLNLSQNQLYKTKLNKLSIVIILIVPILSYFSLKMLFDVI